MSSPLKRIDPAVTVVLGAAQQRCCESGLARAVRPHQGVHLACVHHQVHAAENLGTVLDGGRVEAIDLEQRGGGHDAILRPDRCEHYGCRRSELGR